MGVVVVVPAAPVIAAAAIGTGILPLAADISIAVSKRNCEGSRIFKIFFDVLMCTGTALLIAGLAIASSPLFFTGVAIWGSAAIARIALQIFGGKE